MNNICTKNLPFFAENVFCRLLSNLFIDTIRTIDISKRSNKSHHHAKHSEEWIFKSFSPGLRCRSQSSSQCVSICYTSSDRFLLQPVKLQLTTCKSDFLTELHVMQLTKSLHDISAQGHQRHTSSGCSALIEWATLAGSVLVTLALLLAPPRSSGASDEFPSRTMTNVVVWGASGATDACNRILSRQMEKVLGVRIDVVNMIGGKSGAWGMRHVMNQPRDGYTLCGFSEGCAAARALGENAPAMRDWLHFIAITAPIIISVPFDSPFASLNDLLQAARGQARNLNVATSGVGTSHHLNLLLLEQATGITFKKSVFPGSSPAQEAVLGGEAQAVISALPEQTPLLQAKKLRPLAVFADTPLKENDLAQIPPVTHEVPSFAAPFRVIVGFSVPVDIPTDVRLRLEEAFAKAIRTEEFSEWARSNHYHVMGITGDEALRIYEDMERTCSEMITLHE